MSNAPRVIFLRGITMSDKFIDCDCEILKFIEYSMGSKLYKCESCKKLHIVKLNNPKGVE